MQNIYLDSAATTQVYPEVVDKMAEVLKKSYGNPSSTHAYGRVSKSLMAKARKNIAHLFKAKPHEIIFTSGGTEADNLILNSAVRDLGVKRIISSKIEHHAVLHTLEELSVKYGVELIYVDLDKQGFVDYADLEHVLKQSEQKTLVSLMHVNNEVGNKLNVELAGSLCKKYKALFHSDTVQSIGHYKMDFEKTPIDFATASAHKFHGPKGIGFAFVREHSGLRPLIFGGAQEKGFRAGTESVHNIVGMEKALNLVYKELEQDRKYIQQLKTYFIEELQDKIPNISFNGGCTDSKNSTYTLINIGFPIAAEKAPLLLFQLDLKGIACSKGSACQSGNASGSHVLEAINVSQKINKPSVRFSLSKFNTKKDIDYTVKELSNFYKSLQYNS